MRISLNEGGQVCFFLTTEKTDRKKILLFEFFIPIKKKNGDFWCFRIYKEW